MEYTDEVTYSEAIHEVVLRNGSVSINRLRATVKGFRACVDGCWAIVSCQGCSWDASRALRDAKSMASRSRCPGMSEAELFRGRSVFGRSREDYGNLVSVAKGLCEEVLALGLNRCEVVLTFKELSRELRRGGEGAVETKFIEEALISVGLKRARYGLGTANLTTLSGVRELRPKDLENLFRMAISRARASAKAKALSPLSIGRSEVVLTAEAPAALIHELSHLLEADLARSPIQGLKVSGAELSVYDDPPNPSYPSVRVFDDEGVVTFKRALIEGGRVVDLHHTRATAAVYSSNPGSAHNLFHPPRPYHTTLVMELGDWREEEIVEETRKGYLIDGVAAAFLDGGVVRIVPEAAYLIDSGEVREPVHVRAVKIPVSRPIKLLAVGRVPRVRTTYEGDWLVSEVAPAVKVEAYVE